MADRPDSTASFILDEIRADRKDHQEFRREIRDSLRSARMDSQSFHEEMNKRVGRLEMRLAVENATKEVLAELPSSQAKATIAGMNPVLVKSLGGLVVTVLGALAVSNALPAYTAILSALAALIAGWLGLPQPGVKAQVEAKLKAELEQLEDNK